MHITNNGDVYAGLSGGGIYRSTDNGESWTQVGITAASVKKIVINPSNNDIFTAVSGVARSTDAGQSWLPINSGLTNYSVNTIVIKDAETFFIGAERGGYNPPPGLFRSTNNGSSWVKADTGLHGGSIYAMTVDTEGNIYAGDYNGIYKSTNDGSNWVNTGPFTEDLKARELRINSSDDLFFASWGNGVWRKLSGDTLWTNIGASLYQYIGSLFIGSNDYIYAEKYKSTDNGNTWSSMTIVGNNISSYAENSLGHIFCGTYNFGDGVSRSTDYGETWEQINTGLPTMDVRSVAVDSDDYLYAGPLGYSLFKTTTSTATNIDEIKFEPVSFELNQNYPNPFNPTTKIKYQISDVGFVTLRVYDVLGNEVALLVNEKKEIGNYEVSFDASNLSSGVYIYQLNVNEFINTKKMVLMK
jgi:photosystem II stability/assembly factor-like uncharacterized protein